MTLFFVVTGALGTAALGVIGMMTEIKKETFLQGTGLPISIGLISSVMLSILSGTLSEWNAERGIADRHAKLMSKISTEAERLSIAKFKVVASYYLPEFGLSEIPSAVNKRWNAELRLSHAEPMTRSEADRFTPVPIFGEPSGKLESIGVNLAQLTDRNQATTYDADVMIFSEFSGGLGAAQVNADLNGTYCELMLRADLDHWKMEPVHLSADSDAAKMLREELRFEDLKDANDDLHGVTLYPATFSATVYMADRQIGTSTGYLAGIHSPSFDRYEIYIKFRPFRIPSDLFPRFDMPATEPSLADRIVLAACWLLSVATMGTIVWSLWRI